jgi:hypothetical protein
LKVWKTDKQLFCYTSPDELMIDREVMDFPDGTRGSIIGDFHLKNSKITKLETVATPL